MPERVTAAVTRPLQIEAVLDAVAEAARVTAIETYLVGGFVRDRLLGREGKDLDLVTVGVEGVPILDRVARQFGWPPPQRFDRFGTGQIRGEGFVLEVVRARSEEYDPESRKPDVKPGTLEEDVWRRDFTVNALCQTLDGQVLDLTGRGLDDLRSGILRTPRDPADTFAEDPLRMFRGARFVAQLDFALTGGIIEAMRGQAHRVGILSIERVSEELRRILLAQRHPSLGFYVLRDGALLDAVLPEVSAMIGVEQGGYHIYDVFDHTMRALDESPADLITRAAVLLHDVGKPPTHAVAADGRHTFYDHPQVGARISRELLTRLRFSNDEITAICRLVSLHLRPIQYDDATFSDAAVRRLIRDAGDMRSHMLDVARADTRASSFPTTQGLDDLEQRMARLDAGGEVSHLRDPLTGDEIMRMAGRGPGPWVGRIKRAIQDAVLEGTIPPGDSDSARNWLESHGELLTAD
jgi:poly(A) polymerase